MAEMTITGPQLAKLAGSTYRQFDYWRRSNAIEFEKDAAGQGSRVAPNADECDRYIATVRAVQAMRDVVGHRYSVGLHFIARMWEHYRHRSNRRLPAWVFDDVVRSVLPNTERACVMIPPSPPFEDLLEEATESAIAELLR